MRGATYENGAVWCMSKFQSTLLMRGATAVINERGGEIVISIHALHARSDGLSAILLPHIPHFNPRSSCEERQVAEKAVAPHYTFQSTLLMRGATTDTPITTMIGKTFQSTLLMRGATTTRLALLGIFTVFQSTLLMRGATV